MVHIKRYLRTSCIPIALMLSALALLTPKNAQALAMVCGTNPVVCVVFDGACKGTQGCCYVCFSLGPIALNLETDYISLQNGQAWLMQGQKKTPFASDEVQSSMLRINAKYPFGQSTNQRDKQEAERAWDEFFRSTLNKNVTGRVSADRLLQIKKETGLTTREVR
jgi:hypothetical protein